MNWRSVGWNSSALPAAHTPINLTRKHLNARHGTQHLSLAFLLAIALHVAVIWGVGFSRKPAPLTRPQTLEVIFVQEESTKKSQNADYLAQAQLEGASDRHADVNPAAPLPPPLPDRQAQIAMLPQPDTQADPIETRRMPESSSAINVAQTEEHVGQKDGAQTDAIPAASVPNAKAPEHHRARSADSTAVNANAAVAHVESTDPQPRPDAARLISNSFAMASLSAEIDQRLESRSKRLRQKFVSASTQEYKFAAYMEAWRAKVERIGNLNYPEEARRQHLSGSLLLDVAINPDGSVADIVIRRPSGHPDLDAAAVRIVRLAAPFAPFPEEIRRETDVLHITRSWQFMHNYQFASKR